METWSIWAGFFRGIPYGDPYVAGLTLAAGLGLLGIVVKKVLGSES